MFLLVGEPHDFALFAGNIESFAQPKYVEPDNFDPKNNYWQMFAGAAAPSAVNNETGEDEEHGKSKALIGAAIMLSLTAAGSAGVALWKLPQWLRLRRLEQQWLKSNVATRGHLLTTVTDKRPLIRQLVTASATAAAATLAAIACARAA